ncbi:tRNA glutamyl-Q(34) synthetase GluQRS [Mesorhizobium marinum]|uniref:tRNA glutamyl-Q(34) synthetase GluQRS n=1 Tax=Mesorhizobium marinum TaxID=3228790 RepID=UPI003465CDD3
MSRPVFRFAPSPNGELHLGHAYSALLNQRMARAAGGRLLLRIEDIDTARCTPQFEEGIYRDLAWLGIAWETPVRRQSEHFDDYAGLLRTLIAQELVYPAFMSRGEARAHIAEAEAGGRSWPRDPDGVPVYPGLDRRLGERERKRRIADGQPFAWRLDTGLALAGLSGPLAWDELSGETGLARTVEADPKAWGDVILARREIATSYHLSVVADDAGQGVTHVVRGRDLYSATAIHRLLQELLGLPAPAYCHHRLILGPDGRKLSKSLGDTGLAALRAAGRTPQEIKEMVGL